MGMQLVRGPFHLYRKPDDGRDALWHPDIDRKHKIKAGDLTNKSLESHYMALKNPHHLLVWSVSDLNLRRRLKLKLVKRRVPPCMLGV